MESVTRLDLQKAAVAKRMGVVSMKIGLDELSNLGVPAIAHVWGNHFVVVEGKQYTLTATTASNTPTGYIKGEITIHTNNPYQPQIKVPVYALWRSSCVIPW